MLEFIDSLPNILPISNMFQFLLVTVTVSVIGSLVLLAPVGRNQ
jgi:hypothetical protein